jgi:hypothetical protein
MQEWILPSLRAHLFESPTGWSLWRIVSRMIRLYENELRVDRVTFLFERIGELLHDYATAIESDAGTGTPFILDPSRCFFEEALRRCPAAHAQRGMIREGWAWPWIGEYLESVACDTKRPMRQRSYAALVLAKRLHSSAKNAVKQFEDEGQAGDGGAAYVGEMLNRYLASIDSGLEPWGPADRALHKWDGVDAYDLLHQYFGGGKKHVSKPAELAGVLATDSPLNEISPSVALAAEQLVRYALLSIDVTRRRTACDTLTAAGAAPHAAALISRIVLDPDVPEFVRETGCVVLGYMGDPAGADAVTVLATDGAVPQGVGRAAVMALAGIRQISGRALERFRSAVLSPPRAEYGPALAYAVAARALRGEIESQEADMTQPMQKLAAGGGTIEARVAAWATVQLQHAGQAIVSPLEAGSSR